MSNFSTKTVKRIMPRGEYFSPNVEYPSVQIQILNSSESDIEKAEKLISSRKDIVIQKWGNRVIIYPHPRFEKDEQALNEINSYLLKTFSNTSDFAGFIKPALSIWESGGNGSANIICSSSGAPLKPVYIPRNPLCNKRVAKFVNKSFVRVYYAAKINQVVVEEFYISESGVKSEVLFEEELKDVDSYEEFSAAVKAAVKKARIKMCFDPIYISKPSFLK